MLVKPSKQNADVDLNLANNGFGSFSFCFIALQTITQSNYKNTLFNDYIYLIFLSCFYHFY